ncbi:squalene synthase HpnC [Rubinisphaera italica]|uniref:All-trans-phytoene synthase n=1 Tax=Rubinisphaera italica TaxID=2527969 RepID=A0A5C5XBT9_9PLAN|nr:squalene synthase HpnC [Rubinisphaera italica]TWT60224.1 All-trans-phytoene synthase [Rubinisphaera italica]
MEYDFRQLLSTWGPDATVQPSAMSLGDARQFTKSIALGHYENFPVVSFFLPRLLRQPFYDIYSFCRWSDDLGDELPSTEESLRHLQWWRGELDLCLKGSARHPITIALAETIQQFSLPAEPFHDLISAFERDQIQNRYKTYSDLLSYCQQSANPVGRLLLHLAESATPSNLQLSDNVCTGLQLINFWQDVARDLQMNRIYLPKEDLHQFGVTEKELRDNVSTQNFQKLIAFEVDRAEKLLMSGRELACQVPRSIRLDIRLFALGGLTICKKIRQIDYCVLEIRPKLSKWDAPGLLVKAFLGKFK